MDQAKLKYFTKRLEDEKKLVDGELKSMGVNDPYSPTGWDATPGEIDDTATEADEIADRFEEMESNEGQIREISAHRKAIEHALQKIAEGTYGTCEVGDEMIEEERLEANPSARTCKAHMDKEGTLEV